MVGKKGVRFPGEGEKGRWGRGCVGGGVTRGEDAKGRARGLADPEKKEERDHCHCPGTRTGENEKVYPSEGMLRGKKIGVGKKENRGETRGKIEKRTKPQKD